MQTIDRVFQRLSRSAFRKRFKLHAQDRAYLARKGLAEILDQARVFVAKRLAPATPANDGKQTPMRGHPVFVAQHATATCCRTCLATWHGLPQGRPLSAEEQAYVIAVIERWLTDEAGPGGPPAEPRLL